MTYKCSLCGAPFEDGEEYARHVGDAHGAGTAVGVSVAEEIKADAELR